MTKVDLIALGFVALTAFIGWKKGLIASALSLAGVVFGAWLGSRLAPQLLQNPVAYFSAEFGFHETLPISAGGLGILAGDHAKSASDLGLGFVGVTLFYR